MHFYESSIITTKDGLHCQVYGNEHPCDRIIVKPKYIPTEKIECDALPYRFISGKKMNRLNMWIDKNKLGKYIEEFKKNYPQYIYSSDLHDRNRLFFAVPLDYIERIYFPRRGLSELMTMPEKSLDDHLKVVYTFVQFLLNSGLEIKDLGITYSTLMGHYLSNVSDINIVIYGKEKFWRLMKYLETANHPRLRWKTDQEWMDFYNKRNRFMIFDKKSFLRIMHSKKSEGFFGGSLFVIFAAEKEEEVWFKWGAEKYNAMGLVTVKGTVTDNFSSVVRPGRYEIKDSEILSGDNKVEVKSIVFHSRDYALLGYPGDRIVACGLLERVDRENEDSYYRVVVGYFDAYTTDRREKEYIKVISDE